MFTLNCKGDLLTFDAPIIMGIINATSDSFYKGNINDDILALTKTMLDDGATILDIGGQSSRPKSKLITVKEELERVLPIIELIHKNFPKTILSVDTFYSQVAIAAINAGASIINDISAGTIDKNMIKTVAKLHVPYVCMHMQGTPSVMQLHPHYNNIATEILDFFITKIDECKQAGIVDIIVDPGFGFGKTINHNFSILKKLEIFRLLNKPILVGISRKSTIYKTLQTSAANALNGTSVLNTIALLNGANILRVHDVKEAEEAISLFNAYKKAP